MKLTSVEFTTVSGGSRTILLQHLDSAIVSEYYNDTPYDKAISGKIRQNFRGYRRTYTFKYEHSTDAKELRLLINDILTDLNNGEDSIVLDTGLGTVEVVPTDNFVYSAKYYDQIGKFPPTLEFVDTQPNESMLGGWVEPGWVDPQWVVTLFSEDEPPTILPVIHSFYKSDSTDTSLTFTYWFDKSEAVVKAVEYEVDGGGNWIDVGSLSTTGSFQITGLTTSQQYDVQLRVITTSGTTHSQVVSAVAEDDTTTPPPSGDFNGFWDSQNEFFGNVGKGFSPSQALDLHNTYNTSVIPSGMGFTAGSRGGSIDQWKQVLNGQKDTLHEIGSGNTYFILLKDEPYLSGWTNTELESLIDEAKSILNTDGHTFKFGFTFTRGDAMGWGGSPDTKPTNMDYAGLNFYPFVPQTGAHRSESGFKSHFDDALQGLRDQCNLTTTRFFITGQAFYGYEDYGNAGQGWEKPPENAPTWYAEKVQEHSDVDGLLYYEWASRTHVNGHGCNEMPTYYTNIKNAFNTYF